MTTETTTRRDAEVTLPERFPPGTQALLSVPKGTFHGSGTQRWRTVGADGLVSFTGLEADREYVLRIAGRVIPVKARPSGSGEAQRP